MPSFTQANRTLIVDTPLGKDKLLLSGISGNEQISGLFEFHLEMWSEDPGIAATSIVGKNITFRIKLRGGGERLFNGFVRRFTAGLLRDKLRLYRAEVVPWMWFLTQTSDCKIFQDQTVPEIIEAVFGEYGFADYRKSGISGSHPKREYCVQYRETDFAFLSRLMEQEGIFYFFEHGDGKHTLVLADANTVFAAGERNEVSHTYDQPRPSRPNDLTDWQHGYEYRSGKWTQSDYNFIDHPADTARTPFTHLETSADSSLKLDKISQYEDYDFPGAYQQKPDGTTYSQTRMEEDDAPFDVVHGAGRTAEFTPGTKFKLAEHDCPSEAGKQYVLTSVTHFADEDAPYRLTDSDGQQAYRNEFICIPAEVTYRPPRVTAVPGIRGTQTAVVTGPAGEEIWPDKYGRVKVQFFWDRIGVRDEKTSCWVRCAQSIAGKGWGTHFLPRIGQEVVVTYLDGNPDRPLITGVVYNADQMPPYNLPDDKTKSGVRTNSSKGGDGYNEIRFEDLAGSEQIFVHAQKDMDLRVLNDRMEHVLNDRHLTVGDAGKGSQFESVEKDKHLHVKGNQNEKIDQTFSRDIGMNFQQKVGMNAATEAGAQIYLKAPTVVIEADAQLTLKVGGNFIAIDPATIAIKGTIVLINSGGAAGSGTAPQVTQPTEPTDADDSETGIKSAPDSLI